MFKVYSNINKIVLHIVVITWNIITPYFNPEWVANLNVIVYFCLAHYPSYINFRNNYYACLENTLLIYNLSVIFTNHFSWVTLAHVIPTPSLMKNKYTKKYSSVNVSKHSAMYLSDTQTVFQCHVYFLQTNHQLLP